MGISELYIWRSEISKRLINERIFFLDILKEINEIC